MENTNKKREKFLKCLCEIANYWKDKENASWGAIFSTLVLFDGGDALNDFERLEIKGITSIYEYELHEDFCRIRADWEKENGKML